MSAPRPVPGGLIFDLDGTLVDSFADITTALNLTRRRYRLPALSQAEVKRHVGSGAEYLVRRLVPLPEAQQGEAYRYYLARYGEKALEQTRLMAGAAEVLHHFRDRKLAVVTNKGYALSRQILQGLGVWERFQVVLGGDSLARSKPDPLPIRHVLKAFALPPASVVMVGDGLHDIRAGKAAGVQTVAVASGVESRKALESEVPTWVIDRLDELFELFA